MEEPVTPSPEPEVSGAGDDSADSEDEADTEEAREPPACPHASELTWFKTTNLQPVAQNSFTVEIVPAEGSGKAAKW